MVEYKMEFVNKLKGQTTRVLYPIVQDESNS